MGIGHITESRETTHGGARDGGRTLAPQRTTVDPLKANVDPFKARQIQLENLRPVAEAMRKHELATKGIEKASATRADIDEIRNGLPEGEHAGMWKDDAGVWRPALNNEEMIRRKFETENTMGVSFDEYRKGIFDLAKNTIKRRKDARLAGETNDIRAFVNRETGEDIAVFEGDCEEALIVGRIGENFARAETSVAGDAGAMNSTALGRIGADNAQLKTLKSVGGDEFDAGEAARQRTDLWARQYVRQSLEGRMKAAVVLASQSGGLMSPAAAMKRANEIYDGQAQELMRQLVEAGEYERARMFVGHAEELGYSGAVKAKALAAIDRAEIGTAVNAANVAINAVRDADGNWPAGRVEEIDRAIATVQRVGKAQPKGSKLAADAATAVAQMDRHADIIRVGELFDRFDQAQTGANDLEKAKNPYKKGTRDARCWDMARTSRVKSMSLEFNKERAAARKNAVDLMEAKQLDYARQNPARYYEDLVVLEQNGTITELDRKGLVQKFEEGWAKGFVGQGNEQAMLLQKAEAIAKTLDEELGGAFKTEIRRDKDGFIKPAADGSLVYDPKATPTDLTWGEKVEVPSELKTDVYGEIAYRPAHTLTVRHTLTAEEKLEIANRALQLAKFDGMELGYDPVTGIPMDDGKKHRVNLITDLKRMCGILKSRKESKEIRDKIFNRLRRGKPTTFGDAIGGINPLEAVASPWGMSGAIMRTIGDYDAGVQADRTAADKKKFSLGGMLQGLKNESRSLKD